MLQIGGNVQRLRLLTLVLMAALVGANVRPLMADDMPTRVVADESQHVFVSGTPDTFDTLRAAIDKAKRETGRDYRVIIVGDGAPTDREAGQILDELLERWSREEAAEPAAGERNGFDPSQDVAIFVNMKRHRIAMHAPWSLQVANGLDAQTIHSELIDKLFVPRAKDGQFDEGLAALVSGTERWVKERHDRQVAKAEATRVFWSRTVPRGLVLVGSLAGLGWLLLQRSRHDRRLQEARAKLAAFKSEVVSLTDILDSQQERHRMLPHTDPDFITPMEGQTRSAYEKVQSSISRYRERWLSLMDVWEKAEKRINAEWSLGTSEAEEAIQLLDSAEARPPLADVVTDCQTPLDGLEQAHEKAREMAGQLETELTTVGKRFEGLATRGRSSAPFQAPLADATRQVALARQIVESDPLAARVRLEAAQAAASRLVAGVDACEATDARRGKVVSLADEVEKKVQTKRAEGWLLSEPGADPSALIQASREQIAVATQLLDAGENEGSSRHLEQAEKLVAEALAMLESIVAAKARIDELLPGCASRLQALTSQSDGASTALEQLSATYAETSWADVAENIAKADEGLSRSGSLITEAQAAAQPSRQHYFRAVALLEEAVRQEDWVEGCHRALTDRRTELNQLKSSLPQRCTKVVQRIETLGRTLHKQATDRVRANEQCREAGRLVEVAQRGLGMDRPDLLRTGKVLDAADTAAAHGEELAADDERLARQGFTVVEEADKELRRVAAWYAEGVSPDVRGAAGALEQAKSLLTQLRYEESIKASAEASRITGEAYAAARDEAERRRRRRVMEAQRRQIEDSYARMSRGSGPWVITLPGGTFSGPDPWRTVGTSSFPSSSGHSSRSAGGSWSSGTAEGSW